MGIFTSTITCINRFPVRVKESDGVIKMRAVHSANDNPPTVKFTFLVPSYGALSAVALQGAAVS